MSGAQPLIVFVSSQPALGERRAGQANGSVADTAPAVISGQPAY